MTSHEDPNEQARFALIREHEGAVEAVAERDDALGATAQCLLKWSRDEPLWKSTVEASHFNLDVGSAGFERWSPTYNGDPPDVLSEYAEEFAAAANATDDPAAADAYRILAAIGRGEAPPDDVASRVVERAADKDAR